MNDFQGLPFRQNTLEDFIWTLGYIINCCDSFNCIESEFISIAIDRFSKKFKVQLNDAKSDYVDLRTNSLTPAGLYTYNINQWASIIKELEELINSPNLREYDLQSFLEKYPELIKQNRYDTVIPEATITTHERAYWSADFILKPVDQFDFCKIIEIKKPILQTYLKDINRHSTFSSRLFRAIYQLKDYGEVFSNKDTRDIFKNKYKFEVYKPDLHLIIGRKWDVADTKIILDFQRSNHMKVETWDDFLKRIKTIYT